MQRTTLVALFLVFYSSSVRAQPPETATKVQRKQPSPYDAWLNADVAYIITDAERKQFNQLNNDLARDRFIDQFWLRRDPTPDTFENEYREEHYRRIAYADEHFACRIPGWKTDRGRTYILYGPPDEIESHPGATLQRPVEQGGGQTSTYPFEQWRYHHLGAVEDNIVFEFVDPTMTGQYLMTGVPQDRNALADRLRLEKDTADIAQLKTIDLAQFTGGGFKLGKNPFGELERMLNSHVLHSELPIRVRTDFIPVTPASVLTYITLQVDRNDRQSQVQGRQTATTVYGRLSNQSRRIVEVFEGVVKAEPPLTASSDVQARSAIYQTSALFPGTYTLDVAVKETPNGGITTYQTALQIQRMDETHLSASSLIIADGLERAHEQPAVPNWLVIGDTKFRPRVAANFRLDEKLVIYQQLYHFSSGATGKTKGTVVYRIQDTKSGKALWDYTEDVNGPASQVALEKMVPLRMLGPGSYRLTVRATDHNSRQTISSAANFTVLARSGN